MEFEWDEQKNKNNIIKHGISFQEAKEIFKDPSLLTYIDDRFNYEETRQLSIGQLFLPKQPIIIVLVVHTDRNGVTRIISARRASRKKRKFYEQQSL
ncbi:BrnT family toxin [Crocosphaera subtropica]|uniref:BrnT family toxin n=1 Tax=Crocosphaera subtropica TaxID=2546360 RepID=UPI0008FF196E|nr:BrnT family toxin [Crocosphaera subtropica]